MMKDNETNKRTYVITYHLHNEDGQIEGIYMDVITGTSQDLAKHVDMLTVLEPKSLKITARNTEEEQRFFFGKNENVPLTLNELVEIVRCYPKRWRRVLDQVSERIKTTGAHMDEHSSMGYAAVISSPLITDPHDDFPGLSDEDIDEILDEEEMPDWLADYLIYTFDLPFEEGLGGRR